MTLGHLFLRGCLAGAMLYGTCSVRAEGPLPGATSPRKAVSGFEWVTYQRNGTLAGRHDEITIFADGRVETPDMPAISSSHKAKSKHESSPSPLGLSRYLSQSDLDKLENLVKQVDWQLLLPEYISSASGEGFSERVAVQIHGTSHETVISDPDAKLPPALVALGGDLRQLIETYVWLTKPDTTAPVDFSRVRWMRTTHTAKGEDCTFLEVGKDRALDAWERHKGTVWGLWSEDNLVSSVHGEVSQDEMHTLRKLVAAIDWDKVVKGQDAPSANIPVSHSLWLDVGKRTYYFSCDDAKAPPALVALFGQLDSVAKGHKQ